MPAEDPYQEGSPASRACLLAAAAIVSAAGVAGCGGSSPSPTVHGRRRGTTASTSSAASARLERPRAPARPGGGSRSPGACAPTGSPTSRTRPGGGFAFHAPGSIIARVQGGAGEVPEAPAGRRPPCPGSKTPPPHRLWGSCSRSRSACASMASPQFPDPRTSVPSNPFGIAEITDFEGAILLFPSTINMQAPAYRQALTACGAPPLGLRH